MSLLDILDEKFLTPAASYIKILSQYKKDEKTLFCFVEGIEDVSFYSQFIERYNEENVKYIICNGKENVIDNYKNLDWNFYNKKRVLFFIDKDFDDYIENELINDENVFITDFYSVENYLVGEYTLEKFIIDNCLINDEEIIKIAVSNFKIQHREYVNQIKMISAWMMYCRKNKFNVNFNEIKISDLFSIDDNGVLKKKDISTYGGKFKYICNKTSSSYFDISEIKRFYDKICSESQPQKFIRGKYDLHFMFLYLKYISEKIVKEVYDEIKIHNRNCIDKITKPKLVIQINEQNIFQVLTNKVQVPENLKSFIKSI